MSCERLRARYETAGHSGGNRNLRMLIKTFISWCRKCSCFFLVIVYTVVSLLPSIVSLIDVRWVYLASSRASVAVSFSSFLPVSGWTRAQDACISTWTNRWELYGIGTRTFLHSLRERARGQNLPDAAHSAPDATAKRSGFSAIFSSSPQNKSSITLLLVYARPKPLSTPARSDTFLPKIGRLKLLDPCVLSESYRACPVGLYRVGSVDMGLTPSFDVWICFIESAMRESR